MCSELPEEQMRNQLCSAPEIKKITESLSLSEEALQAA
jgi:hypothetical protein